MGTPSGMITNHHAYVGCTCHVAGQLLSYAEANGARQTLCSDTHALLTITLLWKVCKGFTWPLSQLAHTSMGCGCACQLCTSPQITHKRAHTRHMQHSNLLQQLELAAVT
jgi:hypothetical protein